MKKAAFSIPSIASKAASLFKLRKDASTMFNQPFDNVCPHYRIARILYAVFLTLLILISIPVITLKAKTYSFIEENRNTGFVFETTEKDGEQGISLIMAALPRVLYHAPAKLALITAVLSLFLGAAHLGFVGVDWRSGKRTQTYAFRRNIMFLHLTNGILILFALVSISVTHKSTSHFRDGYVNFRASRMNESSSENVFQYNIGTFDLETWACELRDVRGAAMVTEDYGIQCSVELGGRAVMIPFVIIAWLVAGIGIWGLVGGGRRGPDGERMKTEDVGLEMKKMNATDP